MIASACGAHIGQEDVALDLGRGVSFWRCDRRLWLGRQRLGQALVAVSIVGFAWRSDQQVALDVELLLVGYRLADLS